MTIGHITVSRSFLYTCEMNGCHSEDFVHEERVLCTRMLVRVKPASRRLLQGDSAGLGSEERNMMNMMLHSSCMLVLVGRTVRIEKSFMNGKKETAAGGVNTKQPTNTEYVEFLLLLARPAAISALMKCASSLCPLLCRYCTEYCTVLMRMQSAK
jgi:hypothetical protein